MRLENLIAWLKEGDRASWKHRAYLYLNGLPHVCEQYYKEVRVIVVLSVAAGTVNGALAILVAQWIVERFR